MPQDRYQYDSSKVSAALEAASNAATKQQVEKPAPDPPQRESGYGRIVCRSVGREKLPSVSRDKIERRYASFCPACEGVMFGTGAPLKIMTTDGKEADQMYTHLSRRSMQKNGEVGCLLCRLVLEELRQRTADSDIGDEEENHVGYDFGYFLDGPKDSDDPVKTYAVIFHEFTQHGVNKLVLSLQDLAGQTQVSTSPSLGASSTDAAIMAARIWLKVCDQEHTCFRSPAAPPGTTPEKSRFLPKRLIDVGEDDQSIRLVVNPETLEQHSYMTLSHCWGDIATHGGYSLTTARLPDYIENISEERLPQTFIDACRLTRALRQRYIWIDSLCIVQDSKEDWSEQSVQMWQVYTNSYLNVSATASTNPSQGLFRKRLVKGVSPCILYIGQDGQDHPQFPAGNYRLYSESHWARGVDAAPVNSRAWVLQERLLAPRILHFSEMEVFWECACRKASESFPLGILPLVDCNESITIKSELVEEPPCKVPFYGLLKIWSSIIERYSPLQLSFSSDKLVALSALAEQVSVTYPAGGKYVAGLWDAALPAQLLWRSYSPRATRRAKQYSAPSWSWACIEGPVQANFDFSGYELYGDKSVSRHMLKVIQATTVTNAGQPYGSVKSGELQVAGCLLKVRLQERVHRPHVERQTPQQKRQAWIEMMAKVTPGYTGEDMQVTSNSMRDTSDETHFGIDVHNGIMVSDESSGWFDGGSWGPKVCAGDVFIDITLDTEDEMAALVESDLFLLPVSCISANDRRYNREGYKLHGLGCLLIVFEGEQSDQLQKPARYRRVGMCEIGDETVPKFLCQLGNQEEKDIGNEGIFEESLLLEDFVPKAWYGKELDFIPHVFKRVKFTMV